MQPKLEHTRVSLAVLPGCSVVMVVLVMEYCLEVVKSPSSSLTVVARDWMPESWPYIELCHCVTFSTPLSGSPTEKETGGVRCKRSWTKVKLLNKRRAYS